MQNIDNKLVSKPAILAQLVYKAIVRYVKAKNSLETGKSQISGLTPSAFGEVIQKK